ncbi:MAG: hypothetical protein WBB28_22060 [Crinalium sp.]
MSINFDDMSQTNWGCKTGSTQLKPIHGDRPLSTDCVPLVKFSDSSDLTFVKSI